MAAPPLPHKYIHTRFSLLLSILVPFSIAPSHLTFAILNDSTFRNGDPVRDHLADAVGLRTDFYQHSCPLAESIINTVVMENFKRGHSVAAALLRLAFHDCFVQGCDASVLLRSVKGNLAERDAKPNKHSLKGFDVIHHIKKRLEEICPLTVSCADIVVLSARDAVALAGGPYYTLLKGRRDSLTSSAQLAETELPTPFDDPGTLKRRFKDKGLNETHLVSLLGSHTLGQAHCDFFSPRLYNFSSSGLPDPRLNLELFYHLSKACPRFQQEGSRNHSVPLDRGSNHVFDNSYFKNVIAGRGVLFVDQSLMDDDYTSGLVREYADDGIKFFSDFAHSMLRLSNLAVLTDSRGEIRKDCSYVNDHQSPETLQSDSEPCSPSVYGILQLDTISGD